MMFCDRCDRGYHTYCAGLQAIPDGSWQCSVCDPPAPSSSISPTSPVKGKRGRPSSNSRLSPQQSTNNSSSSSSSKIENVPTRASSRRSRQPLSTPLSPSNSSSSTDLPTTNSSSMNLILTRHQQQWTTTSTPAEIKSKT